jgi:RHS repeat-associated protein
MTTPDGDHNYTYDNLYQLKAADYPAASTFPDTTFNYDPVGNRTSLVSSATTNYTSNNLNQYAQVGPVNLIYDLNGNLTSIATNSYSYDSENRLTSATTASHTASYGYDPFGRRISKMVDGVTTKFLYDGDQIIAEYDGSDNLTAKYVYGAGIDEVLMGLTPQGSDPNKERYYHYDGLGSVTAITNSSGAVIESYSYDAFGKPSAVSSVGNRYMFTGREYDAETGLYYYRARMYSPDLGRFLQKDPIGYKAGINLYTYCLNNPINWIDPMGWDKQGGNKGNFPEGYMNPPKTTPEPPKSGEEPEAGTVNPTIAKDPTPKEPAPRDPGSRQSRGFEYILEQTYRVSREETHTPLDPPTGGPPMPPMGLDDIIFHILIRL